MKQFFLGVGSFLFAVLLVSMPLWGQDSGGMVMPTRGVIENVPEQAPYFGQAIVRDGPGGTSLTLGSLPNGTEVTLGQSFGFWIQITSPKEGFIGSNLVRITETAPVDPNSPPTFEQVVFNSKPEERRTILETVEKKPFVPVPKELPKPPLFLEKYFEKK